MEFTGERFVPGIEDEKLSIEHMQRYMSILPLVKNKKVLDIACGEGYGSSILGKEAADVTGMDIDEETFENDISLRSEFVRLALQDDSLSESERNRLISCGWNVLNGKEVSAE